MCCNDGLQLQPLSCVARSCRAAEPRELATRRARERGARGAHNHCRGPCFLALPAGLLRRLVRPRQLLLLGAARRRAMATLKAEEEAALAAFTAKLCLDETVARWAWWCGQLGRARGGREPREELMPCFLGGAGTRP